MNVRRIIIALVLIAVIAAAGYFGYQRFRPQPEDEAAVLAEIDATAVDTGIDRVSAEGEIQPLRSVDLSFQIGGRVTEIMVAERARVEAGDPLVRLESADLELALRQAQADLSSSQANLEAVQAQLMAAQAAVETADVGVTVAEAQLALVKAGPLPEEIEAVEDNLAAALSSLNQAANNRNAVLEISEADVRAAEARLAGEEASLDKVQENYDDIIDACFDIPGDGRGEICPLYGTVEETVRFQLQIAQLERDAARSTLDSLLEGPTAAQQRAAGGNVALAAAQRDAAEAQLALLLAGPRTEQIQQAEVGVSQAMAAVERAQVGVAQAEAAVSQAEAGVVRAQAAVDSAQAALDKAVLTAVFGGTVANVNVEVGDIVAAGMPVVTLADFSRWLVKTTDLTELDVVNLAVGFPAQIDVDAIPGVKLDGTVTEIASVSQLVRGDVTYEVTIDLEEPDNLPLRWGMTVFVEVEPE